MSYILDALRKADAERERDPARGIHAQPVTLPQQERRLGVPWAAAAAGIAAVVAAAVWFMGGRAPTPVVPSLPMAAAPATIVLEPAPVPAAAPVVLPVAAAVAPPAAPQVPRMKPASAKPESTKPESPKPDGTKLVAAAPAAVLKAAVVAPEPLAAAADRVLAQAELPPDVLRELPKLQISGGVYSENAGQRMLIVGGQVMGEGAEIAPGVLLEQIRARTAVLKFRGYRYGVAY